MVRASADSYEHATYHPDINILTHKMPQTCDWTRGAPQWAETRSGRGAGDSGTCCGAVYEWNRAGERASDQQAGDCSRQGSLSAWLFIEGIESLE